MTRFFLLVFILAFGLAADCHAADKESLDSVQKNLAEQTRQKRELEKQAASIEGDIKSNKGKLVGIGQDIQGNEKTLRGLESRIAELKDQKSAINESLQKDRLSVGRLVLALQRLHRVPPEALIAKPGAPLKTAQSALLMQKIIPVLAHQAESLKEKLAEFDKISKDLGDKREKALAASENLQKQRTELSVLVDKREKLYADTNQDLKEQEDTVRQISLQAQNLQDLVHRLDQKRSPPPGREVTSTAFKLPGLGRAQLPVSGIVRVRYGEPDNFGAPSKGITIEGRDSALIVAPIGGIVRFAGAFRNYGQLIILEHRNGYHSLIAGLKKIDTVVGQNVAAGEPLGFLDRSSDGNKPALYYELRLNDEPVNPSRIFNDLG